MAPMKGHALVTMPVEQFSPFFIVAVNPMTPWRKKAVNGCMMEQVLTRKLVDPSNQGAT